jgi:hypothetical protein
MLACRKVTNEERVELFKTAIAYAITFKFDGKTVTHYFDISWNETWTGSAQVRNVRLEGASYTSAPIQYQGPRMASPPLGF